MATSTLGSGTLVLAGTTSGTTTVTATAVAGTTTLTLPAATDTLVGRATTDTLTNKTLTSPTITGGALNGTVGATTASTGAFTTVSATGFLGALGNASGAGQNVTLKAGFGTAAVAGNLYLGMGRGNSSGTTGNIFFGPSGADANGLTDTYMTLDSSGNLGLGVTPSTWSAGKAIQVNDIAVALWGISGNTVLSNNSYYNSTDKYATTSGASQYLQNNGKHIWYNAPSGTANTNITFTQAMTLDASGNLLVGKTNSTGINAGTVLTPSGGFTLTRTGTSASDQVVFYRGTAGSEVYVGTITTTGTATSYVTSSDYRLKNTIAPMTGALAKVALLKPCSYKWNADGSDGEGFIAHELAEVCPQAVVGEKDAVDTEGNPKYQGIDTSFLVATLTAAIQEQQALITTLTARISALESA